MSSSSSSTTTYDEFIAHLLSTLPEFASDMLEFIVAMPVKDMGEYLLNLPMDKNTVDKLVQERLSAEQEPKTNHMVAYSSSSLPPPKKDTPSTINAPIPVKPSTTEVSKARPNPGGTTVSHHHRSNSSTSTTSVPTPPSILPSSSSSSSSSIVHSNNNNKSTPSTTNKSSQVNTATGNVTNATGSYAITKASPVIPPSIPPSSSSSSSSSSSTSAIPPVPITTAISLRPSDYPVVPLCPCMATKHKCLCNCINCGKIICEYEANRYCTYCSSLLLAVQNIQQSILEKLRQQAEYKEEEDILNLSGTNITITKESNHSKQGRNTKPDNSTTTVIVQGVGSNGTPIPNPAGNKKSIDKDTADFLAYGKPTKDDTKSKKGLVLNATASEFTPRESESIILPTSLSTTSTTSPSPLVSLPLLSSSVTSTLATEDASLAAAIQHKNKLLDFDRNSTARTVVRDDDNEWFDTNRSTGRSGGELMNHVTYDTWLSPEENQRRMAIATEKAEKAAERKRGIRLQFDFTGGRVDITTETALDDEHYVQEKLLDVVRQPIPGFNSSKGNTSTSILNNTTTFPSLANNGTTVNSSSSSSSVVVESTTFANPNLQGKSAEVYREIKKSIQHQDKDTKHTVIKKTEHIGKPKGFGNVLSILPQSTVEENKSTAAEVSSMTIIPQQQQQTTTTTNTKKDTRTSKPSKQESRSNNSNSNNTINPSPGNTTTTTTSTDTKHHHHHHPPNTRRPLPPPFEPSSSSSSSSSSTVNPTTTNISSPSSNNTQIQSKHNQPKQSNPNANNSNRKNNHNHNNPIPSSKSETKKG